MLIFVYSSYCLLAPSPIKVAFSPQLLKNLIYGYPQNYAYEDASDSLLLLIPYVICVCRIFTMFFQFGLRFSG